MSAAHIGSLVAVLVLVTDGGAGSVPTANEAVLRRFSVLRSHKSESFDGLAAECVAFAWPAIHDDLAAERRKPRQISVEVITDGHLCVVSTLQKDPAVTDGAIRYFFEEGHLIAKLEGP